MFAKLLLLEILFPILFLTHLLLFQQWNEPASFTTKEKKKTHFEIKLIISHSKKKPCSKFHIFSP